MVKKLYRHGSAVERAASSIWEKLVNVYGESAGADWDKLTPKRRQKVLKTVRIILKVTEREARTRPPR
jgi:hypothetical protein